MLTRISSKLAADPIDLRNFDGVRVTRVAKAKKDWVERPSLDERMVDED